MLDDEIDVRIMTLTTGKTIIGVLCDPGPAGDPDYVCLDQPYMVLRIMDPSAGILDYQLHPWWPDQGEDSYAYIRKTVIETEAPVSPLLLDTYIMTTSGDEEFYAEDEFEEGDEPPESNIGNRWLN